MKCLRIAEKLKSPILRMVIDKKGFEPNLQRIISIVKDLVPELKSRKIKLAIENHDRLKAREFEEIIEKAGSEYVGICLDSVNSMGAGEGFETVSEILIPYTINLHVKDFTLCRLAHKMGLIIEGRPAGQGMLDIPGLIKKLDKNGLCRSAILELWTPPESTLDLTIRKEAEWAEKVADTRFAFSDSSIKLLTDYYLDGICKQMIYSRIPDPGIKNRDITRPGSGRSMSTLTPERLLMTGNHRRSELEDEIQKNGLTGFVGGVTDDMYGAAAFDFISPHDNVRAKKSWFFFDNEYACLGTGIQPSNTCYEYVVLPGAGVSDLEKYARAPTIIIVANTPDLQAVYHKHLNMAYAVFYQEGKVSIPGNMVIETGSPCMLMIQSDGNKINSINVSDPSRKLDKISLAINRKIASTSDLFKTAWDQKSGITRIDIELPGGKYAGKSVTIKSD